MHYLVENTFSIFNKYLICNLLHQRCNDIHWNIYHIEMMEIGSDQNNTPTSPCVWTKKTFQDTIRSNTVQQMIIIKTILLRKLLMLLLRWHLKNKELIIIHFFLNYLIYKRTLRFIIVSQYKYLKGVPINNLLEALGYWLSAAVILWLYIIRNYLNFHIYSITTHYISNFIFCLYINLKRCLNKTTRNFDKCWLLIFYR